MSIVFYFILYIFEFFLCVSKFECERSKLLGGLSHGIPLMALAFFEREREREENDYFSHLSLSSFQFLSPNLGILLTLLFINYEDDLSLIWTKLSHN